MNRRHEQIEELQRRIKQNARHLDEMHWAILIGADDAASLAEVDKYEIALQAENMMLLAELNKLENRAA